MGKLESPPLQGYVLTALPAGTEVEVVATYEIANICTDYLHLGRTTLAVETPALVIGLPNQKRALSTVYELGSSECEELRRQGLNDQAEEVRLAIVRSFVGDNPVLFGRARAFARTRAFKKTDIINLRLEA